MKHLVNQSGFTLIEMLITISIIGIISAMAAPSFHSQIAHMRQKEVATHIEMALKQARVDTLIYRSPVMVGIKNNQVITAQAIGNATNCTIESSNSNTCKVTKIRLDERVTIDVQNAKLSDTVYFTVNKKAYVGLPTDATPTLANNITYGFCYNGVSSRKLVVKLNTLTNVVMGAQPESEGTCS